MSEQKIMIKSNTKDFLLYLIVGAIATVTEWVLFFLLNKTALHYTLVTVIAYVLSTFVNWLAGRILVFKVNRQTVLKEISEIYIASIVGLLLNLVIMWILVGMFTFEKMFSKIAATAMVFIYNFLVRKLFIYKPKTQN